MHFLEFWIAPVSQILIVVYIVVAVVVEQIQFISSKTTFYNCL